MRLLLLSTVLSSSVFAQPVIVGVVAATNPDAAQPQADALASLVGGAVKQPGVGKVFKDQESLALAVSRGEVDVALIGPLAWLRIDAKTKTQLLVRAVRKGKTTYRAVLFAPPKSPLTSLEVLKQQQRPLKVAWTETSSATGYVLAKATLLAAGINPAQSFETQDFLGTHDAVCKAVFEGRYQLGATFSDQTPNGARVSGCLQALGPKTDTLTVVAMSPEVPNDVVVAAPKFAQAAAVVAALKDAGNQARVQAALLADGVAPVADADFAPVRKALDAFVP